MPEYPKPTRLRQYINAAFAGQHGHRRIAIADFVLALVEIKSGRQAALARGFDNFEAAAKRLSRLLHNPKLDLATAVEAHALWLVARLPRTGLIRIAIDWTSEGTQHLLVASLLVGRRAVPLLWRAYASTELKGRQRGYEHDVMRVLVERILAGVDPARVLVTCDRGFGDVATLDVLDALGVGYIIRAKSSVHVEVDRQWRALGTLRFRTNQRRRSLGRVRYCASAPRRVYLTQARATDRQGRWGIWYLLANRRLKADAACTEYARRFGCEEGFRDSKRMLGFAEARIRDTAAWSRMFLLVAIALVMLIGIGHGVLRDAQRCRRLLREVRSRRRGRSELSLVRAVTEVIERDESLWDLFDCHAKFNLDACL